jgi:hypothetical protein
MLVLECPRCGSDNDYSVRFSFVCKCPVNVNFDSSQSIPADAGHLVGWCACGKCYMQLPDGSTYSNTHAVGNVCNVKFFEYASGTDAKHMHGDQLDWMRPTTVACHNTSCIEQNGSSTKYKTNHENNPQTYLYLYLYLHLATNVHIEK